MTPIQVVICILLAPFAWFFAVYVTAMAWQCGLMAGQLRFMASLRKLNEPTDSDKQGG